MKDILQKTWAIAWKNLQVMSKDRGELAIMFLLPLLFSALLGFGVGGGGGEEAEIHLDAYLVNQDEGPYGEMVAAALEEIPVLRIIELSSVEVADEMIGKGERLAAVVIPADFSERIDAYDPTSVDVIIDPLQEQYAAHVTGLVNYAVAPPTLLGEIQYAIRTLVDESGLLDDADPAYRQAVEAQTIGAVMTQLQEVQNDPLITVTSGEEAEEAADEEVNPFAVVVPGFTVMFAFFLMGTVAQTVHNEKDHGTFRRLLAAPLDRGSIVGGTILAFMIIVFFQVVFLFGIAAGVFNMPVGKSFLGLGLITLALSVAATSLGLFLASVTKTGKQAGAFGLVLGFVLAGLGGCLIFFRVYEAEGFLGIIGRMVPHSHAVEGYYRIMVDGLGVAAVWPQALILFGFAIIFFLAAMFLLKFE